MSAEGVAQGVRMHVGRVYLSEIENGRKEVCVRTLERIADALSVSLDEFFQKM
jgi:transcriptional regulator with XRE-family HTH domain